MAINPVLYDIGVNGGEDRARLNQDGMPTSSRGRPLADEYTSRAAGVMIRDSINNDIARRSCQRPRINWFREDNRIWESID